MVEARCLLHSESESGDGMKVKRVQRVAREIGKNDEGVGGDFQFS